MGKLVAGAVLLGIAFFLLLGAATLRSQRPGPIVNLLRVAGLAVAVLGTVVGAGMMTWYSYQEWQSSQAAA